MTGLVRNAGHLTKNSSRSASLTLNTYREYGLFMYDIHVPEGIGACYAKESVQGQSFPYRVKLGTS